MREAEEVYMGSVAQSGQQDISEGNWSARCTWSRTMVSLLSFPLFFVNILNDAFAQIIMWRKCCCLNPSAQCKSPLTLLCNIHFLYFCTQVFLCQWLLLAVRCDFFTLLYTLKINMHCKVFPLELWNITWQVKLSRNVPEIYVQCLLFLARMNAPGFHSVERM